MNRYTLFPDDCLVHPLTRLSENTDQEGGILRIKGGALIDGKLKGVTIISVDDSIIKISALATLDACLVHGKDVIVEGIFSGEITAKGDVELGESCSVMGTIEHGGALMISALAEIAELTTKKVGAVVQNQARRAPVVSPDEVHPSAVNSTGSPHQPL
jgi:Polymer-forming cytoskeletal